jgi:hypothetical protein
VRARRPDPTTTTRLHPPTAGILIRHYLEMVAAMAIGMIVLAPLWIAAKPATHALTHAWAEAP